MMEPTGKLAYDLAIMHQKDLLREAERDRLLADLKSDGPGPFDRFFVFAGNRMISLGERLRQNREIQSQLNENPAPGL
jgi:hypothetical protein